MAVSVEDNIQTGTNKDQRGKLHPLLPERPQPDPRLQGLHARKRLDPTARVLPHHYVLDLTPRAAQQLQADLARAHRPAQLPGEGSGNFFLPGIDLDDQGNHKAQQQQSRRGPEDGSGPMQAQHANSRSAAFPSHPVRLAPAYRMR